MNKKPWGVYLVSLIDMLFGFGALAVLILTGLLSKSTLAGSDGNSFAPGTFVSIGVALLLGLLFFDTAFSTLHMKKRALLENTVIAVLVLLGALGLLYIDSLVPAGMYTGGRSPLFNIPLHLLVGLYAAWNIYYFRRSSIKAFFTNFGGEGGI